MLIEIDKCNACGGNFAFDTCRCAQIILKQGQPNSLIVFLPRCPHCNSINSVEMSWAKYNMIDY